MVVVVRVWLKMLLVMAVCHLSTIITYVNTAHKVAGCAVLTHHRHHGNCAATMSFLLALRSVHVGTHR